MGRTLRFLTATALSLVVAAPSIALAQRRAGGSEGGSQGGAAVRSAPASPSGGEGSRVAGPRTAGPRAEPSGASGGGGSSRPAGGGRTVRSGATAPAQSGRVASGNASRSRGARGVEGVAQARSYNGGGYYPSHPIHYPSYGYGYPAYGYPAYGYGYYPGYASVGFGYPWYCCGSSFSFGVSFGFGWGGGYPYYGYPYGAWYGGPGYWGAPYAPVFVPVPYGVTVTGDPSANSAPSNGPSEAREERRPTGSVRLRANPAEARVYVDGAFAGTVDDFNGFSDHLTLEEGRHLIELRADGYQPYSTELVVAAGRTMTARANLTRTP